MNPVLVACNRTLHGLDRAGEWLALLLIRGGRAWVWGSAVLGVLCLYSFLSWMSWSNAASPDRAVVVVPKKSDPPRGSVRASATVSRPSTMGRSQRAFWAGVPKASMASPTMLGRE